MIQLRSATILDLDILLHWDMQQHVIDADPDDDWDWTYELPRTVPWREQLIAELNGNPIGMVQIIDPLREETHYWGDLADNLRALDIWIGDKDNLGKGYGTKMMNLALAHCFNPPEITAVLIDPLENNIKAHRFYERLGFKFLEKRDFDETRCCVYQLTREAWQRLFSRF